MVAQPWRRAGKLGISSGLCVAPLQLGGLRGKKSTPSVWLGGTGVVSMVGKWEWRGAVAARGTNINRGGRQGKMYASHLVE